MSMAFSCAGARLHGRCGVGAAKCRPAAADLLGRRGSCLLPGSRRWGAASARGIRADLPPRVSADGGAAASGPAVAVPEAGDDTEQVGAAAQPVAPPERHGKAGGADVDDGAGGNGKFPPGGGGGGGGDGDGENDGGGGGDGGEGEDEFGPILSFDQVVQEAEKRGVSLPSLPADMVEAAKSVGIQKLLLLRYLDMQVSSAVFSLLSC